MIAPVAVTLVTPVEMEAPVPRFAKLIVAPVAVKLLNGTIPPIVPASVTVPVPALKVRFLPATSGLIVPVTKIFPAPAPVDKVTSLVLVLTTFPVRVILVLTVVMLLPTLIAPVKATAPVVDTAPVWMIEAPVIVNELKGVVAPTAPVKVTVPPVPPVNVSACAPETVPLIVFVKVMFAPAAVPPPFVASKTMFPVKITGPVIVRGPPLVVKLLPRLTAVVAV